MSQEPITAEDLTDLVARFARANAAFMRGDMAGYLTLIRLAPDFTLMDPFGGKPTHGFDESDAHLEALSRFFQAGRTELELVQTYVSGQLAVLVIIERQRAEVGGLPDQDWSLRVTLVFRREGGEWWLAHRHADPLVHGISLEQAAAIARGLPQQPN
jgi:ketosteroid isomerase-like protein